MSARLAAAVAAIIDGDGSVASDWANWTASTDIAGPTDLASTGIDLAQNAIAGAVLSSSEVMVFWGDGSALESSVLDVGSSGTTMSWGSVATVFTGTNNTRQVAARKIAAGKFLIGYQDTANDDAMLVVGTWNGSTWSTGTAVTLDSGAVNDNAQMEISEEMNGYYLVGFNGNTSFDGAFAGVSVSGDTITIEDSEESITTATERFIGVCRGDDDTGYVVYCDAGSADRHGIAKIGRTGGAFTNDYALTYGALSQTQQYDCKVRVRGEDPDKIAAISHTLDVVFSTDVWTANLFLMSDSGSAITETDSIGLGISSGGGAHTAFRLEWVDDDHILTQYQQPSGDLMVRLYSALSSTLALVGSHEFTGLADNHGGDMVRVDNARVVHIINSTGTIKAYMSHAEA